METTGCYSGDVKASGLAVLVFCPSLAFACLLFKLCVRCRPSFARGFHLVLPIDTQMSLMLALSKTSMFCHAASIKQVEMCSDAGLRLKEHNLILMGLQPGNKKSCKSNPQIFTDRSSKHVLLRSWSCKTYCARLHFCKDSSEQASGMFQFIARLLLLSFRTTITTLN